MKQHLLVDNMPGKGYSLTCLTVFKIGPVAPAGPRRRSRLKSQIPRNDGHVMYEWKPLTERTWHLIEGTLPGRFGPDTCCFLWAAALAEGLKPYGGEMAAGGAALPGQRIETWGIMSNPATNSYYVTCDKEVDISDAGYLGHCWVEKKTGEWDWRMDQPESIVYDAMAGYAGPCVVRDPLIVYHRKASLLTSIKRHFKREIAAVRKAARKDKEYQRLCAELAAQPLAR